MARSFAMVSMPCRYAFYTIIKFSPEIRNKFTESKRIGLHGTFISLYF